MQRPTNSTGGCCHTTKTAQLIVGGTRQGRVTDPPSVPHSTFQSPRNAVLLQSPESNHSSIQDTRYPVANCERRRSPDGLYACLWIHFVTQHVASAAFSAFHHQRWPKLGVADFELLHLEARVEREAMNAKESFPLKGI